MIYVSKYFHLIQTNILVITKEKLNIFHKTTDAYFSIKIFNVLANFYYKRKSLQQRPVFYKYNEVFYF